MREALLVPVMLMICVLGFAQPHVAACGYLWYALMRPDILAFVEDKYPFSMVVAAIMLVSCLLHRIPDLQQSIVRNPLVRMIVLLQIPIGLSVLFAVRTELCFPRYSNYIRMILVVTLIPLAIRTLGHLRLAYLTAVFSLGVIGVKYGLYGIVHGGVELARGYGNMLSDNNFVALGLATNIGMCWYGRALVRNGMLKMAMLGMLACSIAGIVMSNSRGGIIAAGLAALLITMRTKQKLVSVVFLFLMLAGSAYMVKDMFINRMSTLTEYEEEASAASRIEHAKAAVRMWGDHPVFGVGFGGINYGTLVRFYNSSAVNLDSHVAHNSYLQMLVDSGPAAFLLYIGMFVYAVRWLGRKAKRAAAAALPDSIEAVAISRGLQVSLLTYAFGSSFYSAQRIDLPYILLMLAAVWHNIDRQAPRPEAAVKKIEVARRGARAVAVRA